MVGAVSDEQDREVQVRVQGGKDWQPCGARQAQDQGVFSLLEVESAVADMKVVRESFLKEHA